MKIKKKNSFIFISFGFTAFILSIGQSSRGAVVVMVVEASVVVDFS